jgi:hypothetical protein
MAILPSEQTHNLNLTKIIKFTFAKSSRSILSVIDLLHNLIEALREELKQYGEMLAVLELQQETVVQRQANDLLQNVADINAQAEVIAAVRHEREQHQRNFARQLGLDEKAPFSTIIPLLPADYRPLVQALVQENNELRVRVHRRTRQNYTFAFSGAPTDTFRKY